LRKQFFFLLLAVLCLSACRGAATATPGSKAPVRIAGTPRPTFSAAELEITDPKKTVAAAAGEEFTITIRTNPVSGYHWELAQELDAKLVQYVWKDFVPLQPDMPNSAGRDVWRFKALAPGETKIVLGYYVGMTEDSLEMLTFNVVVK
jgi:predicted secreted protein